MKYLKLILFTLIFVFAGCTKDIDFSSEYNQQVKENVSKVFGIDFPETQDWCTTINGSITVNANTNDYKLKKIQLVLVDNFDSDNISIRLLNESEIKNGETKTLVYDIPDVYDNLYAVFVTEDNQRFYKGFKNTDLEVAFNKQAQTRSTIIGWEPSYPIPNITPVISGSVETYANERQWLPGEVFYTFDYETTSNDGYDNEFKTLFRNVIFNYFPNGRKYDNLPQIKKSGYYNESVYPITTGDEPIVITPVYKNDGGYHEIAESELYYYYFKGNLSASEIESLPKYRAIDLSTVYENTENNLVEKKSSYVLAFFGDGIPQNGTVGSYKFEPGYKIGFCYKSNSTADKGKKKGEVYGDGRLNYNINSYGNFASSGLGDTDPRMAWMSVNERMYLCVESGTDKDFNDLILEVEGGIEPIIIDPDDPEYNFYTFCYEDQRLGDYDMNDVVLKGTRIDETHVQWTLMATGANDELYIYNIEGEHINSATEVHAIFGKTGRGFINTENGKEKVPFVTDIVTVNKNFSFLDASTQPYIFDATKNWEVKIARRGEDPHAIMIPYDFKWPLEKICIKDAYNTEGYKFNDWGSGLVEDTEWYKYPIENLVY